MCRGLTKAFFFQCATTGEELSIQSKCNAPTTVSAMGVFPYFCWNCPTPATSFLTVNSSCGLASSAQATILYNGQFATSTTICAQASSTSGDPRFGFYIDGPSTGAGSAYIQNVGSSAYGLNSAMAGANQTFAVIYNGNAASNAGRLQLWQGLSPNTLNQLTLTYTGTMPTTLSSTLNRFDIGRQFINGAASATASAGIYAWLFIYNVALSIEELKTTQLMYSGNSAAYINQILTWNNACKLPMFYPAVAAAAVTGGGGFRRVSPRLVGIGGSN
jgi:hypothetical protein